MRICCLSLFLYNFKFNLCGLDCWLDKSQCHLGLWEHSISVCHYFLSIYRLNNESNWRKKISRLMINEMKIIVSCSPIDMVSYLFSKIQFMYYWNTVLYTDAVLSNSWKRGWKIVNEIHIETLQWRTYSSMSIWWEVNINVFLIYSSACVHVLAVLEGVCAYLSGWSKCSIIIMQSFMLCLQLAFTPQCECWFFQPIYPALRRSLIFQSYSPRRGPGMLISERTYTRDSLTLN